MARSKDEEDRLLAQVEGMLMNVAQLAGGLDPLLRVFFGFLQKRTDFYYVIPDSMGAAKLGFRAGAARRLMLEAFEAYPFKDLAGEPLDLGHAVSTLGASKPAAKVVVKDSTKIAQPAEAVKLPCAARERTLSETKKVGKKMDAELSELATKLEMTEEGKQIPIAGNGGVTDRYYWHQSLQDLTVYVQLPETTQVKDIRCDVTAKGLRVRLVGVDAAVLEGSYPAPERVKAGESLWSFEKATYTLVLSMEKTRETWWDCILQGEPVIDTTQVDSSRAIDEYDEGTQAGIRKVMFDQRQKKLGLPTSGEITASDILDKARHLPGSPFHAGEEPLVNVL